MVAPAHTHLSSLSLGRSAEKNSSRHACRLRAKVRAMNPLWDEGRQGRAGLDCVEGGSRMQFGSVALWRHPYPRPDPTDEPDHGR